MSAGSNASASAGTAPAPPESPRLLDVSGLPTHAFGNRAPLWWGVLLLVAIESTGMALLLVSYFYLRGNYAVWPPVPIGAPAFRLAALQAVLLVASTLPMWLSVRAARRQQRADTNRWLILATVMGAALLVARGFEIPRIPFRWDTNAYGSIFWMTFGLHTAHVLTGVLENAMLIALLAAGPVEEKHYGDIEASALLWYMAVLEWVPGFAILYLEPLLFPR